MRKVTVVTLLLSLLLLLAACGGGEGSGSSSPSGSDTSGSGSESAAPAAQDIAIQGKDIAYEPTDVSGAVGQPLNITLNNVGALEHNITWEANDELFIATQPGESTSASRTFDAPGEYGFYCSIPGHREAGMVGKVTIR